MLRDLPGNEEMEAMATDDGAGIIADRTRLQDRLGIPIGRARLIDAYWLLDNEIEPEIVLGSLVHPLSVPFQPTLLSGLGKPEAGLKALTLLGTAAPWAQDELEDEEAVALELAGLVRKLMEGRQFQAALAVQVRIKMRAPASRPSALTRSHWQRAHDDESHTLLRTLLHALASMSAAPAARVAFVVALRAHTAATQTSRRNLLLIFCAFRFPPMRSSFCSSAAQTARRGTPF